METCKYCGVMLTPEESEQYIDCCAEHYEQIYQRYEEHSDDEEGYEDYYIECDEELNFHD